MGLFTPFYTLIRPIDFLTACQKIGVSDKYFSKYFYNHQEGHASNQTEVFKKSKELIITMFAGEKVLDKIIVVRNTYNGYNDIIYQLNSKEEATKKEKEIENYNPFS